MLTANTALYGPLPMFPHLHYTQTNVERIERTCERLMDYADKLLLSGKCSDHQYDAWTCALDTWALAQYAKIGC